MASSHRENKKPRILAKSKTESGLFGAVFCLLSSIDIMLSPIDKTDDVNILIYEIKSFNFFYLTVVLKTW